MKTALVIGAITLCALLAVAAWLWTPDKPRADLERIYLASPADLITVAGTRLHVRDTGPRGAPEVAKTDTTAVATKEKLKKLDSFKREILELNRKSIFFDEFKFRRRVSDLYVAVANSIEPLAPSQEKGIGVLEQEFLVFQKRFFELI